MKCRVLFRAFWAVRAAAHLSQSCFCPRIRTSTFWLNLKTWAKYPIYTWTKAPEPWPDPYYLFVKHFSPLLEFDCSLSCPFLLFNQGSHNQKPEKGRKLKIYAGSGAALALACCCGRRYHLRRFRRRPHPPSVARILMQKVNALETRGLSWIRIWTSEVTSLFRTYINGLNIICISYMWFNKFNKMEKTLGSGSNRWSSLSIPGTGRGSKRAHARRGHAMCALHGSRACRDKLAPSRSLPTGVFANFCRRCIFFNFPILSINPILSPCITKQPAQHLTNSTEVWETYNFKGVESK